MIRLRALAPAVLVVAAALVAQPASARPERPAEPVQAEPVQAEPDQAEPDQAEPRQAGPMDLFIAFSRSRLAAAGFVHHQAEVNGRGMVWWEKDPAGEPSGPALVFVHGVSDQAGTWFQVAPALAESHRVLLVDLPGHGESEPTTGPLPMTVVIEGLETWLQEHVLAAGEPAPVVVGNSMGAWVAMRAAHRHPERIWRVVAVNGGPLEADTGGLDLLPADREQARRLMAALRDPASPPTPDPVLDDLVRRAANGHVRRMLAAEADLESHLLTGRLGEIVTPVDLVWGVSDRYMGADYPQRLLAGLPRARLTRIEGCGHLPQAECPQAFLERIGEVLALPPPERDEGGEVDGAG